MTLGSRLATVGYTADNSPDYGMRLPEGCPPELQVTVAELDAAGMTIETVAASHVDVIAAAQADHADATFADWWIRLDDCVVPILWAPDEQRLADNRASRFADAEEVF